MYICGVMLRNIISHAQTSVMLMNALVMLAGHVYMTRCVCMLVTQDSATVYYIYLYKLGCCEALHVHAHS